MAKKQKQDTALAEMLEAASEKDKSALILSLAAHRPDIRRECFDFLKSQVSLSDVLQKRSESEAIIALWDELEPDLHDLDAYGGGDYDTEDHVAELLDDESRWRAYASKIKKANIRRPAFQDEFAKNIAGWREIG